MFLCHCKGFATQQWFCTNVVLLKDSMVTTSLSSQISQRIGQLWRTLATLHRVSPIETLFNYRILKSLLNCPHLWLSNAVVDPSLNGESPIFLIITIHGCEAAFCTRETAPSTWWRLLGGENTQRKTYHRISGESMKHHDECQLGCSLLIRLDSNLHSYLNVYK